MFRKVPVKAGGRALKRTRRGQCNFCQNVSSAQRRYASVTLQRWPDYISRFLHAEEKRAMESVGFGCGDE